MRVPRGSPRAFHVLAGAGVLLCASVCRADPQASVGVTAGGVVENLGGPGHPTGAFHLGGRGDVLFLRSSPRDMGLGPYADVGTSAFRNVDVGAGLSWFVPVTEDVPVVVSGGMLVRNGGARTWTPGGEATLFVGSRSYNFHSAYGMALGFFAQSRWIPGPPTSLDAVFGVQVDAEVIALPVLLLVNAFRH